MELEQILSKVVENHNRVMQLLVSGDSAILAGDTIRDLRMLAQRLQEAIQDRDSAKTEREKK